MKILRLVVCACLVLIFANLALADTTPIDPKTKMGGSGSCQSFTQTSLTQTFTGVETGCIVDFTNSVMDGEFGVTLFTQVVNISTPFTGALSCEAAEGSPLSVATLSSSTSCTFSAASDSEDQISPGSVYSLSFLNLSTDPPGGGFPEFIDITLAQTVIATPEPTTMLLFGAGLAGLLAKRKILKA